MSQTNTEQFLLQLENPVFKYYIFWSSILVIKCLLMSPLTAFFRTKNKAPASPEDVQLAKMFHLPGEFKVSHADPQVERVRRAHRNDLENILPYLFAGFFYVLTNPDFKLASALFSIATIARIVHTLVYAVIVVPQPARAIAWVVHYLITLYMVVTTIVYVYTY